MSGTITPKTYTGMTVVTDGFKTVISYDNATIIGVLSFNSRAGVVTLTSSDVTTALGFTPISTVSPAFTGTPTAPTATSGTNTTQLATTAFVQAAIPSPSTSVTSFNTRTGAVTLTSSDVTSALTYTPANLVSPTFTGTPLAPTATLGTNTTQIATTAFVQSAVGSGVAGVSSFNGRTGAVTLTGSDVITALTYTPSNIVSPAFTGTPTAPTAASSDNSTTIATTAFVKNNNLFTSVSNGLVVSSNVLGLNFTPGSLGTFAFAKVTGTYAFGATVAGANLRPAGAAFGGFVSAGSAFSGTWQCLGYATTQVICGTSFDSATLWQRIA